jgi:hypothetical protein
MTGYERWCPFGQWMVCSDRISLLQRTPNFLSSLPIRVSIPLKEDWHLHLFDIRVRFSHRRTPVSGLPRLRRAQNSLHYLGKASPRIIKSLQLRPSDFIPFAFPLKNCNTVLTWGLLQGVRLPRGTLAWVSTATTTCAMRQRNYYNWLYRINVLHSFSFCHLPNSRWQGCLYFASSFGNAAKLLFCHNPAIPNSSAPFSIRCLWNCIQLLSYI